MKDLSDSQLLLAYARQRSELAFAELVHRHVDFVYSTAVRIVRDPHLAEDTTQGVFLALAQRSGPLAERSTLSGWLHRTTRNIAAQTVRTIERRRARERLATTGNELIAGNPPSDWERLAPQLDEALDELRPPERDAILLHYFRNQDFRTVGSILGISDDAAHKRVSRAVERLKEILIKRGITTGTGGLVAMISSNALQGAPAGLSMTIVESIFAAAPLASAAIAAHTVAPWFTMKSVTALVAAIVATGVLTYTVQNRAARRLQHENELLLTAQSSLMNERAAALNTLAAQSNQLAELTKLQSEVLRLRAEVSRLRPAQNRTKPETAAAPTGPTGPAPSGNHVPGVIIAKGQLASAGHATPEAALETYFWATTQGSFEDVVKAVTPERLVTLARDTDDLRKQFDRERVQQAPAFAGIQLLTKRVVSEHEVQLQFKMHLDPSFQKAHTDIPDSFIQAMIRIGDDWKLGADTRPFDAVWNDDPKVQHFSP